MKKSSATIHLYPMSRLVNAPASKWERLIEALEEGKNKAYAYYLPFRETAVAYASLATKDAANLRSLLYSRAVQMGTKKMADDNVRAFDVFVNNCAGKLGRFKRSLLRDESVAVDLQGIGVSGNAHFAAERTGAEEFVFLLAADWTPDDLQAYLEILSMILSRRYGRNLQIVCADARNGKVSKFKSRTRMRKRCEDALKHYARVANSLK